MARKTTRGTQAGLPRRWNASLTSAQSLDNDLWNDACSSFVTSSEFRIPEVYSCLSCLHSWDTSFAFFASFFFSSFSFSSEVGLVFVFVDNDLRPLHGPPPCLSARRKIRPSSSPRCIVLSSLLTLSETKNTPNRTQRRPVQ